VRDTAPSYHPIPDFDTEAFITNADVEETPAADGALADDSDVEPRLLCVLDEMKKNRYTVGGFMADFLENRALQNPSLATRRSKFLQNKGPTGERPMDIINLLYNHNESRLKQQRTEESIAKSGF